MELAEGREELVHGARRRQCGLVCRLVEEGDQGLDEACEPTDRPRSFLMFVINLLAGRHHLVRRKLASVDDGNRQMVRHPNGGAHRRAALAVPGSRGPLKRSPTVFISPMSSSTSLPANAIPARRPRSLQRLR